MKKILFFAIGIVAVGLVLSCSSSNSPESVVKKLMECYKNQDAEGIVELVNLEEISKDEDELEKNKAEMASMLREKVFKSIEQKGGIKNYEIIDIEVAEAPEPGSRAIVTLKTVYNNGDEVENKSKLRMDRDGKWKLSLEK